MEQDSLTRKTVYFLGVIQLLMASVILYFAMDSLRTAAYGFGVIVLLLLISGLGGAAGLAFIWSSGRVTWHVDETTANEGD